MSSEPRPAIQLERLQRTFGDFVAVHPLDLRVEDGEFFSLIGPSGCGKTTTLRMMAGLDYPTGGRIHVHGRDLTDVPAHRRPVNTVFQQYALFPHLDVFENVAFGLREQRVAKSEVRRRVSEMLGLVQLDGRERQKPRQLSGGQQQRVALARALVLRPEVLLLDEPLGALDLKLRKEMQSLIKAVQREVGITFVYVTHDQEEAFSMSSRVAVMNRGRLEQVGPPRDVYRRPASRFVADFVGATNQLACDVVGHDRDRYAVALPAVDAPVSASGPAGLAPGARAALVVRPEAIHLRPVDGGVTTRGTVSEVSYSGPQTVYQIAVASLGQLKVVAVADDDRDLSVGDETALGWEPEAAWLVPGSDSEADGSNDAA